MRFVITLKDPTTALVSLDIREMDGPVQVNFMVLVNEERFPDKVMSLWWSLTIAFWANVMNEQWQINNLISWKFLFKNPSVNPKKKLAYNINWILDPFTQVKSAEHMAKNQFQMYILWFFFHADVKM